MSNSLIAQALWHLDAQSSELAEVPLEISPTLPCTVETQASLISSGTERLVSSGLVPASIQPDMRVPYMRGNFEFPMTYGYSLVGKVSNHDHPLSGQMVHLLHPHQTICQVASGDAFPVPEGIPARRATLASNLETAVNAIWDSGMSTGDKILVVGFGIIGSLVARLASLFPGTEVYVAETQRKRRMMAEQMGFFLLGDHDSEVEFDCAFHCTGASGGLQTAIDQVGYEGVIVELSWYGTRGIEVNLGGDFHSKRKKIISSQVSNLPADRQGRWGFRRRKETVFELLKDPVFDAHITREIPFEELPDFFQRLRQGEIHELACCVSYPALS
ncbi:zinc-binding alcohol dehydrogenase [Pontibacter sp. G13]|uniref:zinc-dependent alcohol dehydrogenase n=1 Tax=Pontibacter sp. G13 TaxID=3074898 RepID=UPI00288B3636|nr:zinc-binding alcohol dehydrogenase [Pontibacter sp. G13]WNJ16800.1 zinc-binding alcohol dehydrogenase [Pontibacter sp. G13]